jgi:hypothetical protein
VGRARDHTRAQLTGSPASSSPPGNVPDVGPGTVLALIVLMVASGGLLLESGRARREIDGVAASVERLRVVRQALDTLHREASSTRRSTDLTADTVADRGHR